MEELLEAVYQKQHANHSQSYCHSKAGSKKYPNRAPKKSFSRRDNPKTPNSKPNKPTFPRNPKHWNSQHRNKPHFRLPQRGSFRNVRRRPPPPWRTPNGPRSASGLRQRHITYKHKHPTPRRSLENQGFGNPGHKHSSTHSTHPSVFPPPNLRKRQN